MYRVFLSPRAAKEIKKLPKQIKPKIDFVLTKLSANPFVSAQSKYLRDSRLANFRIRISDYRLLYDVYAKDKVVYVLRVGHRKDIYK